MAKRAAKSDNSTSSPDPAPAKSSATTPAKSSTPAKTPKSAKESKDSKDKDAAAGAAAAATPTAGTTKPRRQTKPRVSSAAAGGSGADKHGGALLAGLHPVVKVAAVEVLALGLITAGHVAVATMSHNEMGGLKALGQTTEELVWQVGWRALELAIAWFANLDCVDVAMMSFISHAPSFWLLGMFYDVRPATVVSSLAVDVLSPAIPFYLARPLANVHLSSTAKLYNKDLISLPYQALIAALAASVYSTVLVLSLRFLLPRVFVVYFRGMPTLEPAYAASLPALLPVALCFGAASSVLVFAPYVTTGKSKDDDKVRQFDPVQATLGETVWWNFCGYTARTRVILERTLIAVLVTGVSTYLTCAASIDGVGCVGAFVYAGVWAVAAAATGASLALVGRE